MKRAFTDLSVRGLFAVFCLKYQEFLKTLLLYFSFVKGMKSIFYKEKIIIIIEKNSNSKTESSILKSKKCFGRTTQDRTEDVGFGDRCFTTKLWSYKLSTFLMKVLDKSRFPFSYSLFHLKIISYNTLSKLHILFYLMSSESQMFSWSIFLHLILQ